MKKIVSFKKQEHIERTLVLFKPDAVQRGLVGEILARFEKAGLKIVAMKMVQPSEEHLHRHYEGIGKLLSRKGQDVFGITLKMMLIGPIIAVLFEGVEVVTIVRKLVGGTEPKGAPPGTIRGDYSHTSYGRADSSQVGISNLVHASGDAEDAKAEIALWFGEKEIHGQYQTVHEIFTQSRLRDCSTCSSKKHRRSRET